MSTSTLLKQLHGNSDDKHEAVFSKNKAVLDAALDIFDLSDPYMPALLREIPEELVDKAIEKMEGSDLMFELLRNSNTNSEQADTILSFFDAKSQSAATMVYNLKHKFNSNLVSRLNSLKSKDWMTSRYHEPNVTTIINLILSNLSDPKVDRGFVENRLYGLDLDFFDRLNKLDFYCAWVNYFVLITVLDLPCKKYLNTLKYQIK